MMYRVDRVIGAVGYIVESHAVTVVFLQAEFLIRQGCPLRADADPLWTCL